jgi:segregation and condensation protein A
LLPRKEKDEEGNEIDPREEWVQRLLEYRKYKSVLDDMRELEKARAQRDYRGNISSELKKIATKALVDVELESVTLFKLLKAFERVTERYKIANQKAVHQIVQFSYTIEESQVQILSVIHTRKKANFNNLFSQCKNRIHAIVTFLALLELANMEKVRIISGEGSNNFWVEKNLEQAA